MHQAEYFVDVLELPEELKAGIRQLREEYPIVCRKTRNVKEIGFSCDRSLGKGLRISKTPERITITYGRRIDAFRAFGHILSESEHYHLGHEFKEFPHFETIGVTLESSRNGVMTPDNVKAFLRRFSLMGINTVMLYTEDTYEVPGEPFFGYLRGRYSRGELKELDDYAHNLGIEMFPLIQTLGFMGQVLQWKALYGDIADTSEILLVGESKTYELLERMIPSAIAPFRSKRIHVGMDEALGLGTGEYLKRHGLRRTFDIMNEHLIKVCEICDRLKLRPMIWGDMYLRIGSKTMSYYDLDTTIPQDVIDSIPKNIEICYWDYYHTDYNHYVRFIDLHRKLKREVLVAPGATVSPHFWTNLRFAYATIEPCIRACKDNGISQVLLTTWGDDGMEVDIYSTLPAIQFFSELSYNETVDKNLLKAKFLGSCKADLEAYNRASDIDNFPHLKDRAPDDNNDSKWLLWDDPLIGLCEPFQDGHSFRDHYAILSEELADASKTGQASRRLSFPAQISKVLALKCDCRKNLVEAYRANDAKRLRRLLENEVRPLLAEVKRLWRIHRAMWLATYKPFGLEVIEMRYGGLITRLQSLIDRLEQYLDGNIANIPEFETNLLKFTKEFGDGRYQITYYRRIVTPSAIF